MVGKFCLRKSFPPAACTSHTGIESRCTVDLWDAGDQAYGFKLLDLASALTMAAGKTIWKLSAWESGEFFLSGRFSLPGGFLEGALKES